MLDLYSRQLHYVNNTKPITPYTPNPYQPTLPIIRTHLLPRLGFPKNVEVIWEGTDDQIEQYIIGICVSSIIIVGVIALALMVLTILRGCGYKKVGFLCGHFEYDVAARVVKAEEDRGRVEDSANDENLESKNGMDDLIVKDGGSFKKRDANTNDESTTIKAVRTIGTGGFVAKSTHVSITIEEAKCVTESGTDTNYKERRTKEERSQQEPISDRNDIEEVTENGKDEIEYDSTRNTSNNATQSKPELKGFRMKVARIGQDGNIEISQPKPVPKELWLKVEVVRVLFCLCGSGAIVSAGLFYGLGVKRFQNALVNTQSGIARFNVLATKAINVTDNLLDVQQKVEDSLNTTDEAIYNITTSCDLESVVNTTELVQYYEIVKSSFNTFSNTTKLLLTGFSGNVRNVMEAATFVHDQSQNANIAFAIMVLIMCIMIIIIFIMIIGVAFAAYEAENCFTRFMRRVILLPIFILQVILATLFSAIFFILALSGSDFCITPDQHARRVFARIAAGADQALSPLFSLLLFYLSGCRVIDKQSSETILGLVDGADEVLELAHDLFDLFNKFTPQDILTYCSNVTQDLILRFDELGLTMHSVTHQLHDSVDETLDILSCRSIHPVYSSLMHDVSGIEAIFASLLAIAVLSCFMLTLRAALHPIQQTVCNNA